MKTFEVKGEKYFYGNKISDYGVQHGFVDYRAFAKSFDAVLCNSIFEIDDYSLWDNMENYFYEYYENNDTYEQISIEEFEELEDEEQGNYTYVDGNYDVYQWFIVGGMARHLLEEAEEVYTYSEKLDCYVWGVTHYGTSWDYVLTNIKC